MTTRTESDRNLWLFFIIACVFSWLFWVPEALAVYGVRMPAGLLAFLSSPFNPAAFGPLIAALALTLREEKGSGVIKLLRRGIDFRFRKIWIIPILLVQPLIYFGAVLLASLGGWATFDPINLSNPLVIPIAFVVILFTGGPLQEEFGWRGYALNRLQARYGAFLSSLILGVLWSFWHLPAVFAGKMIVEPGLFWALAIHVTLMSVLFTWIYNNTGRSISSVLLFHAVMNLSIYLAIPSMKLAPSVLAFATLLVLFADVIVIRIWGAKSLSRGQPAYPSS